MWVQGLGSRTFSFLLQSLGCYDLGLSQWSEPSRVVGLKPGREEVNRMQIFRFHRIVRV